MGHYDSCYEHEEEQRYKEKDKQVSKDLKSIISHLDLNDKKMLLEIAKNISDYKSFFKVLSKYNK